MTSRTLPLLLALGAALLACERAAPLDAPGDVDAARSPPVRAWVLIYYMAYDNDLDWAASPIFESLREGLSADSEHRLAVVVVADGAGPGGMTRAVLTADGVETTALPTDASADPATLTQQLDWVAEALPAERYGLVLLDHGGRLDELGYDAHPEPDGPSWLHLPEVADALRSWRGQLAGRFELLMLQQCGKGSVENAFELRDTARFLLTSEVAVGAPNGYYAGTLRYLAAHPDADGLGLARTILAAEPERMFGAYSVLDASRLDELASRLQAVLAPLIARGDALRGAGWDLLRRWVRLEDAEVAELPIEVGVPGHYLIATLSTSPVLVTLLDAGGAEVGQTNQVGAVGNVERLVSLDAGWYGLRLRSTHLGAHGPVLIRLVPGPPVDEVYAPAPGESFVDLVTWLESLYVANGLDPRPVAELADWLSAELVVARRVSATFSDVVAGSGLSLMVPAAADVLDAHADYTLYRETHLDALHRLLLGEAPEAAPEPAVATE